MKAQDLKNSILQLAIQGKLVEQRAEEGTAKELLEKIESEKKQLIKEGKINKEKIQLKVTDDEILFDIPESWEWTRVSNITDMYTGNSIPKSVKETKYLKVKNGYDYIGTKDVGFDYTIDYDNGVKIPFEEEKFRNSFKDSILMCIEGGSAGRKIGILDKTVCFGNKLCSFNLIYGEPRFLYYYLQSPIFFQIFKDEMTGIIGGVSITKLKSIVIPLPPLEEQKRIVAKIEELMPYVEKYDVAYSEVEKLNKKFPEDMQKSILQYAIQGKLVEQRKEDGTAEELYQQIQEEKKKLIKEGTIKKTKALPEITEDEIPFDIPENWKWVRFSEVIDVRDGTHDTPVYVSNGYPLITGKDFYNGYFELSKTKYVSENDYKEISKRSNVEVGDILFSMIGGNIGSMILIEPQNYIEMAIKNIALFKQYTPNMIMSKYLMYYLKSQVSRMKAYASGGAQAFVSLTVLRSYLLPLPPLAEQKRIIDKIEESLPYTAKLVKA